MAYRTGNVELPVETDLNWLLNEAARDGVKVINTGQTGPNDGPLYQFIGGNRGQIINALNRIGVQPNQYTIDQFDSNV